MKRAEEARPQARRDGLVAKELADETVVYDLERHKAHCLNHAARLIWERCDGQTTAAEMARRLAQESGMPIDERVVRLGLAQLRRARLLAGPVKGVGGKVTRRDLLRRAGLTAALGLPLVTSLIAPPAAPAQCCSGICRAGTCV